MGGPVSEIASTRRVTLDRQALDAAQAARLRRARHTAMIAGAVALGFYVLAIVHLLWIQHLGLH